MLQILESYSYTAYGELMPSSPAPKVWGYNGEATDLNTGIQYLRARYYDTNVCRFIGEDIRRRYIHNPKSLNRYEYCHNNPIMNTDISGFEPVNIVSNDGKVYGPDHEELVEQSNEDRREELSEEARDNKLTEDNLDEWIQTKSGHTGGLYPYLLGPAPVTPSDFVEDEETCGVGDDEQELSSWIDMLRRLGDVADDVKVNNTGAVYNILFSEKVRHFFYSTTLSEEVRVSVTQSSDNVDNSVYASIFTYTDKGESELGDIIASSYTEGINFNSNGSDMGVMITASADRSKWGFSVYHKYTSDDGCATRIVFTQNLLSGTITQNIYTTNKFNEQVVSSESISVNNAEIAATVLVTAGVIVLTPVDELTVGVAALTGVEEILTKISEVLAKTFSLVPALAG